jgi:hypothetical protein
VHSLPGRATHREWGHAGLRQVPRYRVCVESIAINAQRPVRSFVMSRVSSASKRGSFTASSQLW